MRHGTQYVLHGRAAREHPPETQRLRLPGDARMGC